MVAKKRFLFKDVLLPSWPIVLAFAAAGIAPAWPLAGGLDIFPEFATAPFAWRHASFVPPERRQRLKLIAPDDLEAFLAPRVPPAILTGVEDEDLAAPLVAYARRHGYRFVKLKRKRELWLPP